MQATDEELVLAHTEAHVRHIDGPPKGDEWQIGDNYYSAATPLAARTAAGCTVQVSCYIPHQHATSGQAGTKQQQNAFSLHLPSSAFCESPQETAGAPITSTK